MQLLNPLVIPFRAADHCEPDIAEAHRLVSFMKEQYLDFLAAPQVGIHKAYFAIADHSQQTFHVCFNPRVLHTDNEQECREYDPYCSEHVVRTKRMSVIRFRYTKPNGSYATYVARDREQTWRILHCLDYLEGKRYWQYCNYWERQKLLKKLRRTV